MEQQASTPPTEGTTQNETPKERLFLREKHKEFIKDLEEKTEQDFEYWVTEHLRMSGVYWGLTALDIVQALHLISDEHKTKTIAWVKQCQHENGGFGGNIGHDPHILYTCSAIQILITLDSLSTIDIDRVVSYISRLQLPDGSFAGDEWGEVDTRFTYTALLSLSLLGRLNTSPPPIDKKKAVEFILKCRNFDAAYGCTPGAESHAGQTFCCVGALALADALPEAAERDHLGWWLSERQVENGGLNGRPEKLADVCYSWWVLSSLAIIDRMRWIDQKRLREFILICQDDEKGGISDRPGDMADIFHTFFGIGGISLMGGELESEPEPGVDYLDPAYAMTVRTLEKYAKESGGKFTYNNAFQKRKPQVTS